MRVLILGATGRTAKWLIPECLTKGYQVNCLVRKSPELAPSDIQHVRFLTSDLDNQHDFERAIQGCDAVISTLNISRTSDFPWAKLRTPEYFLSETMKKIIVAAKSNNVRRVVVCSAWGTAETKKELPRWFQWLIDSSNIGFAYRDHERQEILLRQSDLDWTIVRPTGLTNSSRRQTIKESYNGTPKPRFTISRRTVAKYLVDAVEDYRLIHQSPVIFASWST